MYIQLINIANIVSGFVLAAPKIKTWFAKEHVEKAETKLNRFRGAIGIIELVLGVLALLGSLRVLYIPLLGYGLLQAIVAVVMGFLLSASFFEHYPAVSQKINLVKPYSEWIGVGGIIIGVVSMF